ncbi:protein Mpv17-like [Oscarella lobularis]|uniref:protein Mpv17-like n=1 Tax=Oscarella lobularis TaxID=121494 RepID=UPI003313B7E5
MLSVWQSYLRCLNARPLLTQAATSGFLFFAGDVIAQQAIDRRGVKRHDFYRTGVMTFTGLCIAGPVLRFWYLSLERLVPGKGSFTVVLKKIALDQLLFAPVFLAGFFTTIDLLERKGLEEIKKHLKAEYRNALITNYMLWPAVQIITFNFMPLKHRVGFVQLVALGWNTYLAWAAHKNQQTSNDSGQ